MRSRRLAIAAIAASSAAAVASPASAADSVPSRSSARAYFVRVFPPVAPLRLLGNPRAEEFTTGAFAIESARRCHRSRVQVICSFRATLEPKDEQKFDAVKCSGELWAKRRNGKIIGRVGDYKCVSAKG